MKIVGVGCGPGLLTDEAIRIIRQAKAVYGSSRAIELAREHIPVGCRVRSIGDFRNLAHLPDDAVVLSTGDPMLAGLGYLAGDVIPGISSLQVAAARLRFSLSKTAIVVAHGHGHEKAMQETVEEIKRGKIVFLLADPKFDVSELYRRLGAMGISTPVKIAVCENLGYPDERIAAGDIILPPVPEGDLYALVIGSF
jgi:cobalt-precorrin-7 (C5)-methyltransferase